MNREQIAKEINKAQDLLRELTSALNKAGISSVPVQGLGLVREDLGIRRPKRKKRRKGDQ